MKRVGFVGREEGEEWVWLGERLGQDAISNSDKNGKRVFWRMVWRGRVQCEAGEVSYGVCERENGRFKMVGLSNGEMIRCEIRVWFMVED